MITYLMPQSAFRISALTDTILQLVDPKENKEDILTSFQNASITPNDEFDAYLSDSPTPLGDSDSLFEWRANSGSPPSSYAT